MKSVILDLIAYSKGYKLKLSAIFGFAPLSKKSLASSEIFLIHCGIAVKTDLPSGNKWFKSIEFSCSLSYLINKSSISTDISLSLDLIIALLNDL